MVKNQTNAKKPSHINSSGRNGRSRIDVSTTTPSEDLLKQTKDRSETSPGTTNKGAALCGGKLPRADTENSTLRTKQERLPARDFGGLQNPKTKNQKNKKRRNRETLRILTYNLKSGLKNEETKELFINQIKNIKYDVIGICETRATTESRMKWKETGDEIIIGAGEGVRSIGGVGFIINKRIAEAIIEVNIHSPRIATLKLDIGKNKTLTIVQVYAPHGGYDTEVIEDFYTKIEKQLKPQGCYKMVIGDFNAQLGPKIANHKYIGNFTDSDWTETGEIMADFAERNKLFVMNSFFQKPKHKRWTYQSTNINKTRHELDYGLATDRKLVTNVERLDRLNIGSDHRPVRFTINLDIRQNKKRIAKIGRSFNNDILKTNIEKTNWTLEGSLTDKYEQICSKLTSCVKEATIRKCKENRLSAETLEMLVKRGCMERNDNSNIVEYVELSKVIRRKMREDFRNYKMNKLLKTLENRKSLTKCRKQLQQQIATMKSLKDKEGKKIMKRRDMERRVEEYYTEIFSSQKDVALEDFAEEDEEIPKVIISEVRAAIKTLKNDKAPGPDGLTNEVLKSGDFTLCQVLANLFNECFKKREVPNQWKTSSTIIIPKKGDREDLKNYRPITLLPTIYKVFTKLILNRLSRKLDDEQPREQAGFRSGYSTMDHLQSINQILERCREYHIPLCLVFVDYEKAFDSIEINAVINALAHQGIETTYLKMLLNINNGCTTKFRLFYNDILVPVKRGVRQGDTISPKLFTAALEDIFRKLEWDKYGITIDGEKLHHLRFADDIVIFAHDVQTAGSMLHELNDLSQAVGLRINRAKTQAMKNNYCNDGKMEIDNIEITFVNKYTYLGQEITADHKIDGEIQRRRCAAWHSFNNIKEVLKNTKDAEARTHLFNSTVLPALNYGAETWTMRECDKHKLTTTQRAMERQLIEVRLKDKIRHEEIRKQTKFKDANEDAMQRKLRWAGHVARMHDNRWTTRTTFWCPRNRIRPLGRPPDRWRKLLKEKVGTNWRRMAEDRETYRRRWYDPPR